MAHQTHSIPWSSLASHIRFVQNHAASTPPVSGFFVESALLKPSGTGLPGESEDRKRAFEEKKEEMRRKEAKAMNHFVKSFVKAIREFGESERAKYPVPFPWEAFFDMVHREGRSKGGLRPEGKDGAEGEEAQEGEEREKGECTEDGEDTDEGDVNEKEQVQEDKGPKVYPESLKQLFPEFLNQNPSRTQFLDQWISLAIRNEGLGGQNADGQVPERRYTTSHGDLADVVKVLFHLAVEPKPELYPPGYQYFVKVTKSGPSKSATNPKTPQIPRVPGLNAEVLSNPTQLYTATLLALAVHPLVPLHSLHSLSWGHHFGWSRVMESALRAYVMINLIFAYDSSIASNASSAAVTGRKGKGGGTEKGKGSWIEKGVYTQMEFYKGTQRLECWPMDYCAQQIPHRVFWSKAQEITREHLSANGNDTKPKITKNHPNPADDEPTPLIHIPSIFPLVQDYLKQLFRMLYVYDMVVRECGEESYFNHEGMHKPEPEWENQIAYVLENLIHGLRIGGGDYDEVTKKWSPRVFI